MARPTAAQRGYGAKWQRESRAFLARPENRLCACGCGRPAEIVDHRQPHRGDPRLFWSRSNWQGLAKGCHDSGKQREERRGYRDEVDAEGYPVDPRHPFNRDPGVGESRDGRGVRPLGDPSSELVFAQSSPAAPASDVVQARKAGATLRARRRVQEQKATVGAPAGCAAPFIDPSTVATPSPIRGLH